jgi:hypothetical protein
VGAAAVDGALPIGDMVFAGICLYRAYRALRLIARGALANEASFDPDAGRMHGDIPDEVDRDKTETQLEEEAADYDTSIRNREQEMRRRRDGGDANHRERVRREREYLRKLEDRLKEVQKAGDPQEHDV